MIEIKHKDKDVTPVLPCQKLSWTMGSRIYGEGRIQIALSSLATIDPLAQFYFDVKFANNAKINHIMVSFTDHYNVTSIEKLHSKTKVGKDLWYLNNYLFIILLCLLKIQTKKQSLFSK